MPSKTRFLIPLLLAVSTIALADDIEKAKNLKESMERAPARLIQQAPETGTATTIEERAKPAASDPKKDPIRAKAAKRPGRQPRGGGADSPPAE